MIDFANFAPAADSVLMLLDLQRDFLDDDGRMPVARSHVEPVVVAARQATGAFKRAGRPIVAVGNEFRRNDFIMNLLRRHASLEGSPGARWDARAPIDGAAYFPKWAESAFVNPALEPWLRERGVREIVLGGLRANACVSSTAREAMRRGFRVTLLTPAIACSSDGSRARSLARLRRAGADIAA